MKTLLLGILVGTSFLIGCGVPDQLSAEEITYEEYATALGLGGPTGGSTPRDPDKPKGRYCKCDGVYVACTMGQRDCVACCESQPPANPF